MRHRHHPVLLIVMAAVVAGLAAVHCSAQTRYENLAADARMYGSWTGCASLDDAEQFFRPLVIENDTRATEEFELPRKKRGWCQDIEANERIALEKRLEWTIPTSYITGNWYCVSPYGQPTCFLDAGNSGVRQPEMSDAVPRR